MKKKTVEYGKYGYMFIAPFFLVFLIFQLYPLIYTFYLSFVEYKMTGSKLVNDGFCGFDNYLKVLKTRDFLAGKDVWFNTIPMNTIKNTLIIWIINFIPQILLALLLSAWFTDTVVKLKGQGAFKVMMFLPNIITASSIAVLFNSLFGNQGPVTLLVRKLPGLGDYSFLNSKAGTIGLIGFMQFWMWYGNTMIVLIAGILGISPSLYEAAMVDGANSRQEFFKITLPLLKPILQFSLVTSAIGGLQMYDIPALFNVNNGVGQPGRVSHTVTMMIREVAFSQNPDYGYAGAISVILFICTMIISMIFFIATKDRPDKQKHAVKKA
ncbi:aBC-type sugar transport systems permease components [Coprococcus sp. CAG:782]|jgi:ABC-type sugar transport system permease subunit|uniref:carbohydrate ABC transporter permease n=1 Tax=Coprococcus sp. OM04-5BH TaxID=2293093 RepID=UPI00033DF2AE|nr:sugar ABC transporter permease [Coprococcus sp. OM04-5BH]MEE0034688.1 sugar ABC transporter permease [Coprococcus sp.]RHV31035.1 sugar ABC transporter permease [Coprococcus sp. OM04-5BH]CCY52973.1 aBC-type sugar transport systems permease components [Coprococcus sp. CAG:782]